MDLLMKLLPGEERLVFRSVAIEAEAQQITVEMTSKAAVSYCPVCGIASQRQHSRYVRRLDDMPWADFSVVIELAVGKWFCPNPGCKRHIFTERLPGVVQPWARRTERMAAVQTQLGLTVGGRAGSCLGEVLHNIVSKDSLIRLIRRQPLAKYDTPRVLGIDDWAKRKGQSYGTILVDLESQQVIDVLPERSAAYVEAWLKTHPGVEVISRDRGGEYAAGARAGAPEAMQVADRFHLLKNLGEALTQALKQHSRELRTIVVIEENATQERPILIAVNVTETEAVPPLLAPPCTARKAISLQKQASRRALYDQVCALADKGWMQKTIAAELHLSAKTVSRWLAAVHFPERQPRAYQPRLIEPYIPYLCQRWTAGCRNGAQLRREIEAQGYQAGASGVAEFIAELRRADGRPLNRI